MKVWTHHPSAFRIDDPNVVIDWTLGTYWRTMPGYREALPILQRLLREDQFLWCCTKRGQFIRTTEDIDLVEWELTVNETDVLAYYHEPTWEELIRSRGDWKSLLLPGPCQDAGILAKCPPRPGIAVCLGPLPVKYPKAKNVANDCRLPHVR